MKQNKVIARIWGGLGNQLFVYAAARRLAIENDAELVLDNITGFERDIKYKRAYQLNEFCINGRLVAPNEIGNKFHRIFRLYNRKFAAKLPFGKTKFLSQRDSGFDSRILNFRFKGTCYLEGYWQSELYFIDISNIIRNEIVGSNNRDIEIRENLNLETKGRSVAVHFRFFDDKSNDPSENLAAEYYRKAVDILSKKFSNLHYYIFSDNSARISENISSLFANYTIVESIGDQDAVRDLRLMASCDHFIIANSTFSWWGAWLGNSENKVVVAPKNANIGWNIIGRLPASWISV